MASRRVPEYGVWTHIIGRCYNETDINYHRYGGRGIMVCQRWRGDFNAFFVDMGPRPSERHQVERLDNDGHYEPMNCVWATVAQQARNRRSNRWVEIHGEQMVVTDAERRLGLCSGSIYQKVKRDGCSYQDALNFYLPHACAQPTGAA